MRTVPKLIYNARVVLPDKVLDDAAIFIDRGIIKSIWQTRRPRRSCSKGCIKIDAWGNFVSPGFIDTHIHGLPDKIFENQAQFGTTSILPALSCQSFESLADSVNRIKEFIRVSPLGGNVLGIRLEGPFINLLKAGAQDRRYILKPDMKVLSAIFKICGRLLKMMTIAPEVKGALSIIKRLRRKKIIASIGHSNASYEEALLGIDSGISHATHVFNAISQLEGRSPGAIGAILASGRVTAEVILDLVHFHKALFKLLVAAKGLDRVILITDSVVSGAPYGARLLEGAYRFGDGRLAGSCLTMNRAAANAVREGGLSIQEAVRLAAANPGRAIGVYGKKGSLEVGKDADLVIFDKGFDVKLTIIRGEIAYERGRR